MIPIAQLAWFDAPPQPRITPTSSFELTAALAGQDDFKLFKDLQANGAIIAGANAEALNPVLQGAKAAVFGGAVLAGWYAAQGLVVLSNVSGLRRERLVVAGVTALAALALTVAGFLAQRWCRLPDDEEPGGAPADEDAVAPPAQRSPRD